MLKYKSFAKRVNQRKEAFLTKNLWRSSKKDYGNRVNPNLFLQIRYSDTTDTGFRVFKRRTSIAGKIRYY